MQKKENLINNLNDYTLTIVAPSQIHGVGVFATRDIPKGTEVFKLCNEQPKEHDDIIDLTEEEVNSLHDSVSEIIKGYFIKSHLGTYSIPENGLNFLHFGYYLNHSDTPNLSFLQSTDPASMEYVKFMTNKDVKKGEELTEDYRLLSFNNDIAKQFSFIDCGWSWSKAN